MDFSSNENLLGNSFRKRSHEESLVLLPQIPVSKSTILVAPLELLSV